MQNSGLKHMKLSSEEKKLSSQALPNVQFETQLFSFDEVRTFQQDNKYITHGYRSNLSGLQCLKSAFILSNELVNIWTHGAMVPPLILTALYDQIFILPSMQASWVDHLIFFQFMICCSLCSFFSALFHIFNCHKDLEFATCCYCLDLYGIILVIFGIYAVALYYGFYCIPSICLIYALVVLCMILITSNVMVRQRYLSASWRPFRVGLFSFLALFGVFPIVHWFSTVSFQEVKVFLPDVLILYSIIGVALFFYLARFPEKLWPGQFNFFGNSHNWWHVLLTAGFFYMRKAAIRILDFRITTKCMSSSS